MEAMLYEPLLGGKVRCRLCAHECRLKLGAVGICGVRENREGKLYTHVGDRLIAENVDPIEKSHSSIFFPAASLIPWPLWAAIFIAPSVRTLKSHSYRGNGA